MMVIVQTPGSKRPNTSRGILDSPFMTDLPIQGQIWTRCFQSTLRRPVLANLTPARLKDRNYDLSPAELRRSTDLLRREKPLC